jgi:soluble lytic murein transglycosylase-like protein
LLAAALVGVISGLGRAAQSFSGQRLWVHLLPFAGSVLVIALLLAVLLLAWLSGRRWLSARVPFGPAFLALCLAATAGWFATTPAFRSDLGELRVLVGASAAAERRTIAHQVYASYRRAHLPALTRLLERASAYEGVVRAAADAFGADHEVLMGVAAVESSFRPRTSADGGVGLFQITRPPEDASEAARRVLGVARLDLLDPRHNAFVAAATFRKYLDEMRGDLFLGLLAYNVGPRNGGLRAIMNQYGARDFVTIQPYLQSLPREYPIRVLAAALAYRLKGTEGKLPRYQEGDAARRIQRIGIPGLQPHTLVSGSPRQ